MPHKIECLPLQIANLDDLFAVVDSDKAIIFESIPNLTQQRTNHRNNYSNFIESNGIYQFWKRNICETIGRCSEEFNASMLNSTSKAGGSVGQRRPRRTQVVAILATRRSSPGMIKNDDCRAPCPLTPTVAFGTIRTKIPAPESPVRPLIYEDAAPSRHPTNNNAPQKDLHT